MNIPDPIAISLFCLNTAPFLYYLAVFLGSATLLAYHLKIAAGVFKLFRKRINLKNRYGDNAWALVTGGSEGTHDSRQASAGNWLLSWPRRD